MIYLILYPFSLLPLKILYLFSDLSYYILYHIFRYRRTIVSKNIENSFDSLSKRERIILEHHFYKNFCDNFIETLKLLSISKKELQKRFIVDYSEIEKILSQNKNGHIYLGHQFNWEWANAHISSTLNTNIIVVYKPIRNNQFNKLMKKIRSRFGSNLVSSKTMKKEIEKLGNSPHILVLAADQKPKVPIKSFWTTFLNQKTAFINGSELYTASNKTTSYFANLVREKRGYYKIEITPLFDFSKPYKLGLITQRFAKQLEKSIINQPENYLWSHRRWKHTYKNDYKKRWIDNL